MSKMNALTWSDLGVVAPLRVIFLAGMVIISAASVTAQMKAEQVAPQPPGRLVDVGGYRLHINCVGKGGPTIVMASGLGGYSFHWGLVQPTLSRTARVCIYDRAGYAWSDRDPQPRSLQRAVDELHALLTNAEIEPPFVLVGHSWGGLIVRVFASQYPTEVVGMVLVDSSHEDRLEIINGRQIRVRLISTDELRGMFRAEREAEKAREAAKGTPSPTPEPEPVEPNKIPPPYDKLPEQNKKWHLWARSKGGVADVSEYREPLVLTFSTRAGREHPLGNMPLIVLEAGRNDSAAEQGAFAEALFADHHALQADLAKLSNSGKLVTAKKSGHHIQLDEPKLVITSVKNVLKAVRLVQKEEPK